MKTHFLEKSFAIKRAIVIVILIVLIAAVVTAIGYVGYRYGSEYLIKRQAKAVFFRFVDYGKARQYKEAYSLTAHEFQEAVPFDQFEQLLQQYPQAAIAEAEYESNSATADVVETDHGKSIYIKAIYKDGSGVHYQINSIAVQHDGQWSLDFIEVVPL